MEESKAKVHGKMRSTTLNWSEAQTLVVTGLFLAPGTELSVFCCRSWCHRLAHRSPNLAKASVKELEIVHKSLTATHQRL